MRRTELVVVLALASVIVAACGAGTPSGAATSAPASPGSSSGAASPGSPSAEPTSAPGSEAPTDASPTPKPSKSPKPSPSPSGSAGPGAAECTGTDENKAFFADAAAAVDWTVVCAVLPSRWFVSTGNYRRGGGGRLTIGYKGPDGATLTLNEGAWCTEAGGCAPAGTEVGPAALGPMDGTLFALDGGGFAIVVDQGDGISWQLETAGLSQAKTKKLAAAAVAVTD